MKGNAVIGAVFYRDAENWHHRVREIVDKIQPNLTHRRVGEVRNYWGWFQVFDGSDHLVNNEHGAPALLNAVKSKENIQ